MNTSKMKLNNKHAFIQHIQSKQAQYTNVHRKLANYLINHFIDVAFMRAQQWAAQVDTSEVSVIRFVRVLGYDGYPEFIDNLQQIIRNEMTMLKYTELSISAQHEEAGLLRDIIKAEEKNLQELAEKYDPAVMGNVIQVLSDVDRIIVVGLRSSAALAAYCSYMFMRALAKEVITLDHGGEHMFDLLLPLEGKKAMVVAFGYPRYPQKTLEIMEYVKQQLGFPILAVTNDELSPLVPLANYTIYAPSHSVSFTDSMGAATIVINTIVMEYINRFHEKSINRIKRFESLAKEKEYYWQ